MAARRARLLIILAVASNVTASTASARADEPPSRPTARGSPGMVPAGIVLIGAGTLSVIAGSWMTYAGMTTSACDPGPADCQAGGNWGLMFSGLAVASVGGGVGLGVGIPILARGARAARAAPNRAKLVPSRGGVGLRFSF